MRKSKTEEGYSAPEKVKKPITKKWWFWVIVVVLAAAVSSSIFGSDDKKSAAKPTDAVSETPKVSSSVPPSATPEPTPVSEEAKEAAKAVDEEIAAICSAAEGDYQTFIEIMSNEGTSDLDMYNTAKTLKSNLKVYNYDQLSAVEGEGIDEYKDSVSMYIFMMSQVADKTMEYLDNPITSKLSEVQEAIEGVTPYIYDVAAKRITFLYDVGFTAEEVEAITAVDSE